MKKKIFPPYHYISHVAIAMLCLLLTGVSAGSYQAFAATPPQPFVAIHVSELTQALEAIPATPPTPTGPDFSGYQWWYTTWHYFVAHESLKEALRSDGTPFVEISDSDIAAGRLRNSDGSPRYPILISLGSEAIADNEISPIRDYVNSGGFLFVGSSAFTRFPDGANRSDFAFAGEMGLRMATSNRSESNNWNWHQNKHFIKNITNHRLAGHIPSGTLSWHGPESADEISWGVSPNYVITGSQWTWSVVSNGATVVANGDSGPLLTARSYGLGQFIYHGAMQPLIGHGVISPSMYSYLIYRKAIEWAFESSGLPIVKLSPWRYPYDAALVVRHDFEGSIDLIKTIKSSAQYENALGIMGDYYFCTGALRTYTGGDRATIISNLRDAVAIYGATVGSHNGGLKNPVDSSLRPSDHPYWHWGPDEALDQKPAGYADGKAYATSSIATSFQDIAGWLTGLDNGRNGCSTTNNCPKIWVSPMFNATREGSYEILEQLGTITAGEQKIGPYPHWTLSYKTPGKRFPHLSQPASDWFVGTQIPQALEWGHTWSSIRAAVDFYYDMGAMLLNFYGHQPSNNGGLAQEYVTYSLSKPRIWSTNAVGVYDWWLARSKMNVTPDFTRDGDTSVMTAFVSGSTSTDSALEIVLPKTSGQTISNMTVSLNGLPADTADYRTTNYGLKIRAGSTVSSVKVQYVVSGTSPVALSSLSLNPSTVTGGTASVGTVTLSGPAPSGGVVVSLSDNSSSASVPASVTVPGGSNSATFTITTYLVYSPRSVTISAVYGGVTRTATLTVTAASASVQLSSLSLSPATVKGGTASQGTVTLNSPAPSGGVVVSLSDNSSSASVPASVTVPGGSSSAKFTITTYRVYSSRSVTISAVYGGVTKSATLKVTR